MVGLKDGRLSLLDRFWAAGRRGEPRRGAVAAERFADVGSQFRRLCRSICGKVPLFRKAANKNAAMPPAAEPRRLVGGRRKSKLFRTPWRQAAGAILDGEPRGRSGLAGGRGESGWAFG